MHEPDARADLALGDGAQPEVLDEGRGCRGGPDGTGRLGLGRGLAEGLAVQDHLVTSEVHIQGGGRQGRGGYQDNKQTGQLSSHLFLFCYVYNATAIGPLVKEKCGRRILLLTCAGAMGDTTREMTGIEAIVTYVTAVAVVLLTVVVRLERPVRVTVARGQRRG
jgi:hypothetical protein